MHTAKAPATHPPFDRVKGQSEHQELSAAHDAVLGLGQGSHRRVWAVSGKKTVYMPGNFHLGAHAPSLAASA